MRILSIGYALPNVDIDNYSVLTAPSYFDYDAMVIDPASITTVVRQVLEEGHVYEAHDGRVVVNAQSTAAAVSIGDQVRRRTEETQRLLEAGGTVIVMGRPNATITGVVGFEGCDRYSWLPAPAGVSWSPPFIRAAEGRTLRVVDEQHPLATVLRNFRSEVAYRAVFDERQITLRQAGRIFATGGAGAPTGMDLSVLSGRVIFIPALGDSIGGIRSSIAEGLVAAVQQLVGVDAGEPPPYWVRGIALPGLEQVEAELEEAESAANDAKARVEAVRERHDELAAHRRLFWSQGTALANATADALRLFGFTITSVPREPMVIEGEDRLAMVETEGSKEQVVEWPYVRLQRRLEERMLKTGESAAGIVVVNGRRGEDLEARGEQYTEALRIACENYRYCLVTGETLFSLVQRALGGADEAALTGIRRRLLGTHGLLTPEAAMGEVSENKDAGPIF
jgi:hypothetical protein